MSIKLPVPFEQVKHTSESAAPMFELDTLYYWPIVKVIKMIMQDSDAYQIHLYPFKTYWHPDETQRP
jgi:Plavaka transposase